MMNKVLVAYATKYGATAGIAEKIGQVLSEAEFVVDVLPVDRVCDIGMYKAVVLGSAAYIGRWRKDAAKFLKANEKILSVLPVWLFSSGPTEEADPVNLMEGWHFPKSLQTIADRIKPRDITVFHGAVNFEKLNRLEKWMIKKVKAPVGDLRDWKVIVSWAKAIAAEFKLKLK